MYFSREKGENNRGISAYSSLRRIRASHSQVLIFEKNLLILKKNKASLRSKTTGSENIFEKKNNNNFYRFWIRHDL